MSASMSIARAREILENVERSHEAELKEMSRKVAVAEDSVKRLQEELKSANRRTDKMREQYERTHRELKKRETTLVTERSEAQVKIATLEAEKQVLAERDKEARDELTHLMHQR